LSFFEELKRRNVIKVGIAYAVSAWLLLQLTDVLIDLLGLAEIAGRYVVLLLVIGFPLALIFAWAFEMTPEGIKRENEVDRSQSITHVTSQKLNTTIIGILSVALAFFIFDKFSSGSGEGPESAPSKVSTTLEADADAQQAEDKSIAVMPFVNMSADADNEYFSDGLSEELLNLLAKVDGLKVAARTSSFKFKNAEADISEIGEKLNVATVLEGSVRRSGNQARITAQLIKVDDGFHLWSETYDRDLSNIFQVQDEIARAIVDALKLPLLGRGEAIASTASANFEAYDLYLLAQHHIKQLNESSLEKAVDYLNSAVANDPDYAPAWSALSRAYLLLSDYGTMPFAESVTLSSKAVNKAAALAPDDANTLLAQSYLLGYQGNELQSNQLAAAAIEANPNLVEALTQLSGNLGPRHQEQALQLAQRAWELDPLAEDTRARMILETAASGEIDAAIGMARSMILDDPENPGLFEAFGHVYRISGQHHLAIPKFEMVWNLRPGDVWPAFIIANSYLLLGDVTTAGEWLEKARARGSDSRWTTVIERMINSHERRWETLAADYAKDLASDELTPLNRRSYGDILLRQGKTTEAEQMYRSVLDLYEGRTVIDDFGHADVVVALLNILDPGEERDHLLSMLSEFEQMLHQVRPWSWQPWYYTVSRAAIENKQEEAMAALHEAIDRGVLYRRGAENRIHHMKWKDTPQFREALGRMSAVADDQRRQLAESRQAIEEAGNS
jgi:TolB-like protein/predicted Zn-dependent protease